MEAGALNRRVTIQQRQTGFDEVGQPIDGWADVVTVWANIAHKSGLQTIKADAPISVVQASIRIRYRTGVDAGMRVLYGATTYDIRAVLPDAAGRDFVDLVCEVLQ